jgi:hypothetical protein
MLVNYKPPGPVSAEFLDSKGKFQSIMGPIGGGKTSTNFVKHLVLAQSQIPSTKDGRRKYRVCVVRDTYRNLWATTIKSWWHWVPQHIGNWVGGENNPASHRIVWEVGETKVDFEVQFRAIGDQDIEEALQGLEVTAFFLNEVDKLSRDVFTFCRGRTGRFPKMDEGGPTWHGVTADYNAPDTDSWLYALREQNLPEGFEMFRQPSGISPEAENLENLPEGYYQDQMIGQPEWYIRRMIRNEYGFSRDGQPVYEDYSDQLHCAQISPVEGLPLILGGDAGRKPAAVICQEMPNGQWQILDEVVGLGMGAEKFGERLNQILGSSKYRKFKDIRAWGDPSADYAGDTSEMSWLEIMRKVTKLRWRPAPGNNDVTLRLGAVEGALQRIVDGQPGLLVSPTCKVLRKGFNSHYRYRRRRVGGQEHYDDVPEKNDWSHIHDALQYALLGEGEGIELRRGPRKTTGQIAAITDDNPHGEFEESDDLMSHVREMRDRAFMRPLRQQEFALED